MLSHQCSVEVLLPFYKMAKNLQRRYHMSCHERLQYDKNERASVLIMKGFKHTVGRSPNILEKYLTEQ